jgi:hypothetical protein
LTASRPRTPPVASQEDWTNHPARPQRTTSCNLHYPQLLRDARKGRGPRVRFGSVPRAPWRARPRPGR